MRILPLAVLAVAVATGSAGIAKDKPNLPSNVAQLDRALSAVVATVQGTTPPPKTEDHDQGDDHANPGAILRVCSKDTPAARRSAICPVGVSPD